MTAVVEPEVLAAARTGSAVGLYRDLMCGGGPNGLPKGSPNQGLGDELRRPRSVQGAP